MIVHITGESWVGIYWFLVSEKTEWFYREKIFWIYFAISNKGKTVILFALKIKVFKFS